MSESKDWLLLGSCGDGDKFTVGGSNVWGREWISRNEVAVVKDPLYGKELRFRVYEIRCDGRSIVFAAGEFSNCIWGFFAKK
ncbi:MAG: hypothetical protein AAFX93_09915 [Verrucomicrobiota bacterium]